MGYTSANGVGEVGIRRKGLRGKLKLGDLTRPVPSI